MLLLAGKGAVIEGWDAGLDGINPLSNFLCFIFIICNYFLV